MKALDFEYDGKNLSDFGMIICNFGDKGLDTLSNGSYITFNTVSTLGGSKHELTSTQYEDCLEATIQICKSSCTTDVTEISAIEFRELTRWLNRKKFLKFKILDEDYIDLYFEASFNISRIEFNGRIYGLELEVITNRPFALKEPKTIIIENTVESGKLQMIYNWKRFEDKYIINEHKIEKLTVITAHIYNDSPYWDYLNPSYVDYSSQIDIVDGKINLISPIFTDNILKGNNVSNIMGILGHTLGRYAFFGKDNNQCYRVPYDSVIHIDTVDDDDNGGRTYYFKLDVYELNVDKTKEFKENITSENYDDYPDDGYGSDGYYYVYINKELVQKEKCSINDTSYEEGYIYPHTEIVIKEDGDLKIHNDIENRDTFIANCVAGEVITMDYPVIQSSIPSHNIQNDFNWNFFRVANTFDNRRNDLTISIPCTIKLKYSPIVKVGL